jgi:8-oxo-dGTP pyrophosphatase MutT (NUDIX family)
MTSSKPITYSVALVIYNRNKTKYLIARRPLDDDSLPGYWGFPATSKKQPDESWEDVAHRAAKIKLGVEIEIIKCLGEEELDRGNYILKPRDYEVKVTKGKISVPQPNQEGTQYIEMRWTNNPSELIKSAKQGSLCSRVFLKANNIQWRS